VSEHPSIESNSASRAALRVGKRCRATGRYANEDVHDLDVRIIKNYCLALSVLLVEDLAAIR
jgi:hypothetical protein